MSSIRGEIQLVIGLVIAIVSLFKESLRIFVFLGALIAVYGLIKVVYRLATKPSEKENVKRHSTHPHPQHAHAHNPHTGHPHHAQHQAHTHHPQQTAQTHPQNNQQHAQRQYHPHSIVQKQHSSAGGHHQSVKKCPSCQSVMPATFRHCPHCGFGF